ncbi:PREDICTED: kelch-like protein 5, partial [Thamnophis sirtalis]|uniref:Kelch-like protein 5 n=1 Tax=Thamnophis sirtalis TaxID=35019 RepID=A0A6I9XNX2_9SAUR
MSGSRREFDVKQLLKLRWRWFGQQQQQLPPHPNVGREGDFWDRRYPAAAGGRKFLNASSLPPSLASRGSQRSKPQGLPDSFPRPMAATSEVPTLQFTRETIQNPHLLEVPDAEDGAVEEDKVPTPSACRTPHSGETRLPSRPMEPCPSDEFFQALNHAEQTFKKMENYLRHKQLCDVVLVAGDRRIPAHRLVLSSVSDYFAAMFTNDVREARQEEIKMEGVEPNALWALVQYAYTGRLELKEDNIECLLSTACILQLSQVVEACCKFLMKQLHPSNCLGIRSFADAQGCTDLHKVAHNYTMEHFMEVIRNQEFLLLPATEIAKLLASDDMNIPSEETILNALLTWVQHDLEQRKKDLSKLLAYIRLPLLAPQFLADMENNVLFRDDIECQKLIMEAMKYHLL